MAVEITDRILLYFSLSWWYTLYSTCANVVVQIHLNLFSGNVAKAKAVWESSHKNGVNRAKKAVDGSRASSGVQGQCSQTKLQADPWWVVDLGASYAIKNVVITNRGDCCGRDNSILFN